VIVAVWALEAVAGPTQVYSHLCVEFKPSDEQRQKLVNCEICASSVATELQQPLSPENLRELERIAGLRLYDDSFGCQWGRWLRLPSELSYEEISPIRDNLRTLPWVSGFQLHIVPENGIPRWLDRWYWLTSEDGELELASGQPIRTCVPKYGLMSELNYLFVSCSNAHQITHLFSNIVSNLCSPIWVIQMNTVAQGPGSTPRHHCFRPPLAGA
jgi:hypothetical protein